MCLYTYTLCVNVDIDLDNFFSILKAIERCDWHAGDVEEDHDYRLWKNKTTTRKGNL